MLTKLTLFIYIKIEMQFRLSQSHFKQVSD